MKIEDAFTRLLGRQATDDERLRLYKTRDILGLQDNDALWLLLIALQYHQTGYEAMPKRIEDAVNGILANARKTAEIEIKGTAAKIHGELVQSVAYTAEKVANATAGRSMAQWATGAAIVCLAALITSFTFGYKTGSTSATNKAAAANAWMLTGAGQRALAAYQYDPDRAEWAGTREAWQAYQMYKSGALTHVADCDRPGWTNEKENGVRYCYPEKSKDNRLYGWAMP